MTQLNIQHFDIKSNNGFAYFIAGFSALPEKKLRAFILIPLIINIILFGFSFYFLYLQIASLMDSFTAWLPSFLQWLSYIIWPLSLIAVLVVFSFFFTTLANLIAAPFNALLSERLVLLMKGGVLEGSSSIMQELPRMFTREWQKIRDYLPKLVLFLLLLFIPVVGPILWFFFSAWMMAVQYLDYPFDNDQISFVEMKKNLSQRKSLTFSFGVATSLFSMIPLLNLIVMPAAVCGATLLWLDHFDRDRSEINTK